MHSFSILLCFLVSHFSSGQALSLLDALREHANASKFAQNIESNPNLAGIFLSPTTRTVFAPSDEALDKLSVHTNSFLVIRQSGPAAAGSYQACLTDTTLGQLGNPDGLVLSQQPDSNNSGGAVINDASIQDSPAGTHGGSRKVVSKPQEPPAANITKRTSYNHQNSTKQPVQIFSGLGNAVNITKGDIPYDGGLIHVVDGYFTIPQTFSETSSQKNHTGFASLVEKANLTNVLDSTPEVTIFIPSNEAIQGLAGNTTESPSNLASLLSNHVITGFAAYTPYLVDGTSYTTNAGTKISVSVKNGEYFIDGARIIAPNLITTNGVAHVINKVLTPKQGPASPPVTFASVGWSCNPKWSIFLIWGFVLLIGLEV